MAKRAFLPGASELFRPTEPAPAVAPDSPAAAAPQEDAAQPEVPVASGRIRHDHKITVYFSEDELNALEDANLLLRRSHGIRVDRGRLVRTAVSLALRELQRAGDDAEIVRELRG